MCIDNIKGFKYQRKMEINTCNMQHETKEKCNKENDEKMESKMKKY